MSSAYDFDSIFKKACEELYLEIDIYKKILKTAIDTTDIDVVDLKEAIDQNDFEVIQKVSHRLKGTYSNLRVEPLATAMAEMNVLAKKNEGLGRIKELLTVFFKVFEEMKSKV